MFESNILAIKAAVSPFCLTLDSFEHINMHEHLNETLCFVGVTGYKAGELYTSVNGERFYEAKVRACVDILADRTMTASQLASLVDNAVLPVISNIDLNFYSLERKNCEFSKMHSRYVISIEFEFEDKIPQSVRTTAAVILNGELEPMLGTYRIIKGTKAAHTALVNKTMLSNTVCPEPNKIILKGKLPLTNADAALSRYSALTGLPVPITVGINTYANMALTSIDLDQTASSGCELTLEFTEVNA